MPREAKKVDRLPTAHASSTELRECPRLQGRPQVPSVWRLAVIHRFWMGDDPPFHDYREGLEEFHTEEVKDWTPENLPLDIAALCLHKAPPQKISNLVRLALLFKFGGLWVDYDIEPLAKLTGNKKPWTASLNGQREGCVLWFPEPGHPMLKTCLNLTRREVRGVGAHVLERVGGRYYSVGYEPRVIPYNVQGEVRSDPKTALAIHHWHTTRQHLR